MIFWPVLVGESKTVKMEVSEDPSQEFEVMDEQFQSDFISGMDSEPGYTGRFFYRFP